MPPPNQSLPCPTTPNSHLPTPRGYNQIPIACSPCEPPRSIPQSRPLRLFQRGPGALSHVSSVLGLWTGIGQPLTIPITQVRPEKRGCRSIVGEARPIFLRKSNFFHLQHLLRLRTIHQHHPNTCGCDSSIQNDGTTAAEFISASCGCQLLQYIQQAVRRVLFGGARHLEIRQQRELCFVVDRVPHPHRRYARLEFAQA